MLRTNIQTDLFQYPVARSGQATIQNDVYQLTLSSPSQIAVDEWRRGINSLYDRAGYGILLTLTDAHHSILPPLAYATTLSSIWISYLHRRLHSRNAILCAQLPPAQIEFVLNGLPGYGNNVIRFFQLSERTAAVRWLISDD